MRCSISFLKIVGVFSLKTKQKLNINRDRIWIILKTVLLPFSSLRVDCLPLPSAEQTKTNGGYIWPSCDLKATWCITIPVSIVKFCHSTVTLGTLLYGNFNFPPAKCINLTGDTCTHVQINIFIRKYLLTSVVS